MSLPFHPLAALFPLIEDAEFDDLVASIKANGLRDPIVVHEGMVLDGRNRQRACEAADVDCVYYPLPGDKDPLQYVLDKNLKRRHLTESQRAMVAAKMANLPAHRPTDKSANLPTSQDEAAARVSVSPRSVREAVKVHKRAVPEIREAVEHGYVAVSAAAEVAELPEDEQREVAAKGKKAIIAKASELRDKKHRRKYAGPPVEQEPQHDRDLRMLQGVWDGACPSARQEFLDWVVRVGEGPTNSPTDRKVGGEPGGSDRALIRSGESEPASDPGLAPPGSTIPDSDLDIRKQPFYRGAKAEAVS